MKKFGIRTLAVTGIVAVLLTGCSGTGNKQEVQASEEGVFQNMNTTDLEGNAVDSSVFAENTLTLVNVWNVGCTPCIQEIPALDKLDKEFREQGVAVKGMYHSFGEPIGAEEQKEIEGILSKAGAEYQQLVISEEMAQAKEVEEMAAFPTTFFVDSEGKIVEMLEGSRDYEGWKSVVEKMLEKMDE